MKKDNPIFNQVVRWAAGIAIIALAGFMTSAKPYPKPLKVERQQWILQHMVGNIPSEDFDIGIIIDVPVGGDPVMVDSVTCLLNQALYCFLESSHEPHFTAEEVYCADGRRVLQHYQEVYKPFIVDTCYKGDEPPCFPHFFHFLTVVKEEQTNKYLTYRVAEYFVGEGDFEYSDWVTFNKADGHRLPEVISDAEFLRFLEEHPDLRTDTWDDMQWHIEEGYGVKGRNHFGLKTDSVWNEYLYDPGIIDTMWYDMEVIRPYLTEEAQRLLE
jgi:hypothetical protein